MGKLCHPISGGLEKSTKNVPGVTHAKVNPQPRSLGTSVLTKWATATGDGPRTLAVSDMPHQRRSVKARHLDRGREFAM